MCVIISYKRGTTMVGNKEKLQKRLNDLYLAISDSKDSVELVGLKQDYIYARAALIEIDKSTQSKDQIMVKRFCQDVNDACGSRQFKIYCAKEFLDHKGLFIDWLMKIYTSTFLSTNRIKARSVTNEENIAMTREFFTSLDEEFTKVFEEIISNNTWILDRTKNISFDGVCYPQITGSNSYIFYTYNKNVINILTHEMGHAYSFYRHQGDYLSTINCRDSCFRECFPRFSELAFSNYHMNGKYNSNAINLKSNFFDMLQIYFEAYHDGLKNLKSYLPEYDAYTDDNGHYFQKENIDSALGMLVSIYLFYLYKNDPSKYLKVNCLIDENMGMNEEKIWNYISSCCLEDSLFQEHDQFNEEVKTYQKIKKDNRFIFFK